MECYLGLLYTLEDVAVYGYMTPLKVKIVLTFDLTDAVVRDADVTMVRALQTSRKCIFTPWIPLDISCISYGVLPVSCQPVLEIERTS